MVPEFALVNSGSEDILVTSIMCGFNNAKNNGSSYYPGQDIVINDKSWPLLMAGKSYYCSVKFLEKFTPSFAQEGELRPQSTPNIYQREMKVDIEWIELNGESHGASAVISKYGFTENGHMKMHTPMEEKHDLYKKL